MSATLATRSDAAEAMNNDTLHESLADIYEDRVVIRLIQFSVIWAVVAMTAGVYLSGRPAVANDCFLAVLAFVRPTATTAY